MSVIVRMGRREVRAIWNWPVWGWSVQRWNYGSYMDELREMFWRARIGPFKFEGVRYRAGVLT